MLAEIFKEILKDYTVSNHNVILEDKEIVDKIENEYGETLKKFIGNITEKKLDVNFVCLKGDTLLRVPYAVIYDKTIYSDYTEGLFIGFSIYPEKGLVYLKIDQGLKSIKGNFNMPFVRGEKLRAYIEDIPEEFKFDENKCAAGNVIGKNYVLDALNDETLSVDLEYVLSVYEKLVPEFSKVLELSFDEIVNSIDL